MVYLRKLLGCDGNSIMTVDDLKNFHKVASDAELARLLGKTRGAVSKWRSKGIPLATQAVFQIQSKNKLQVNQKLLSV